jgi:hypothetical protein
MAKVKKIKVWYIFEYLNHDPMLFANAPTQKWVEDCSNKAEAREKVQKLNVNSKRYGFNFRFENRKTNLNDQ